MIRIFGVHVGSSFTGLPASEQNSRPQRQNLMVSSINVGWTFKGTNLWHGVMPYWSPVLD